MPFPFRTLKEVMEHYQPAPFYLIVVVLLLLLTANEVGAACNLCFDGETITKPAVVLDLTDPIPIKSCQDLANVLLVIHENDALCTAARSLSGLCGCPNLQVQNACTICKSSPNTTIASNMTMTRPLQILEGFVDLGDDIDLFGLTPTCALVESGINVLPQDDMACLSLPFDDLQSYCGCSSSNVGENATTPNSTCTLCPGGEIVPDLPIYDVNTLKLNSIPAPNGYENRILCQEAKILVKEEETGSTLCNDIQRGSTVCGCPVPDNACRLCPQGSKIGDVAAVVDSPLFGIPMLCIMFMNQLHRFDRASPECQSLDRSYYEEECGGCLREEEIVPCTLCPGGESVPDPNKRIEGAQGFGYDYVEPTCGSYEHAALTINELNPSCSFIRLLAKLCGCSVPETSCSLCQEEDSLSNPSGEYQWTLGTFSNNEALTQFSEFVVFENDQKYSCEVADSFISAVFDVDSDACYWNQLVRGTACGCSGSINAKVKALVWTQRCSGILSLIGSISIIVFVLTKKTKARWNTYNQIVLSISVFDSLSSAAYIFGSALTPADLGVYGSIGNEATCKFQGWLFQVGITSVYYNVALCFYFLFVVKYNWKERKFEKVRKWIHLAVVVVGITMSLAVIPFVSPDWRWCYVVRPPNHPSWLPGIFFFILPIGICMIGMTVLMIVFVLHIRQVEKKSQTRRFPGQQQRRSLANRTFWQSFYFLAAFYTVWPIQFVAFIIPLYEENYWVYLLAAILGPLQGLLNALVVFYRDHTSVGKRIRRLLGIDYVKERWSSAFVLRDAGPARTSWFRRSRKSMTAKRNGVDGDQTSTGASIVASWFRWNRKNLPAKRNDMLDGDHPAGPFNLVGLSPAKRSASKGDAIGGDQELPGSSNLAHSSGPILQDSKAVKLDTHDDLKVLEEKVEETCSQDGTSLPSGPQSSSYEDINVQAKHCSKDDDDNDNESNDDFLIGQFMEQLGESSRQMGDDDAYEGDAILEYAVNAGILDDSDFKYFERRLSSVYRG